MCGIAGIYNLNDKPVNIFDLKKMCDIFSYRGPDDSGYVFFNTRTSKYLIMNDSDFLKKSLDIYSYKQSGIKENCNLGFGHRRLSIIDLSNAGHQPMSNDKKDVWIIYNGEIYNFKELRDELIKLGYRFFSKTDTEVVLRLYEEYGERCVERLNGMFAFAIWDAKNKKLFLARDRYGIKPLYYTLINNTLIFASEVKSILRVTQKNKLNFPALYEYFTFQNTFNNTTLFDEIFILEPGHILEISNGEISKREYWDFKLYEEEDKGEKYYKNRLIQIIENTIKKQLISDVPVGTYLSGGMDSGLITAISALNIPRLMTFTGGFDLERVSGFEANFDEREDAEKMASYFGTEHYQMVIHEGDFEWAMPRVIWHLEDLRVGMCYPTYYIARLASKFVKVVLGGVGGDEVFAGYPWRYKLIKESKDEEEFNSIYYKYWTRLVDDLKKKDFFSDNVLKKVKGFSPYEKFISIVSKYSKAKNPIKKALYFEAKTFLHGLLIVEDKLSMAHSLEARVPMLDNNIVDFVSSIPTKYLINFSKYKDENLAGKYILREAGKKILPEFVIKKRKQGFSAPERAWYKGKLMNYIKKTLLHKKTLERGYFNKRYIEKIIEEHISGKINHRLLIWSLLSFEWWNRIFLDKVRDLSDISYKDTI